MTTACVVVCYHPDVPQLVGLCAALRAEGAHVLLVDNSESPSLRREDVPEGCTLFTLGRNTGLAHAQNIGIAAALEAGAKAIGLFDQDSQPEPGMLVALVDSLTPGRPEVAAPVCRDDVSGGELPAVRLGPIGRSLPVFCGDGTQPCPVDIVIASGSVATREAFQLAGMMDERYFIDFVDTEWCLRVRASGIPIRVVPAARMQHRIGSASVKAAGCTVLIHSPLRCYYQVRNCFLLLRNKHVPLMFGVAQFVSILASRMLLLFLVDDRVSYLRAYLSGLRDGSIGLSGPKPT